LCKPQDSQALAKNILAALDKECDGEKICNYAQQFTWENISREIMEVYHGIIYMLGGSRDSLEVYLG